MDNMKDPKNLQEFDDFVEQTIDKCVEDVKKSSHLDRPLSEKETKELRDVLKAVYLDGKSPKEAMKIDDEVITQFYSYAYNLYQGGKFKEASSVFYTLISLDPQSPRNMLGLAACFHKMQLYKEAAKYYFACSLADADSPIPFFHMADCFIQLDDPLDAHIALTAAAKRCGSDPTYATLKGKCHAMLESLKKTLEGDDEPKSGKPSSFDLVKQNTEKKNKAA